MPIMLNKQLSSFVVLDIEPVANKNGRFALAEATVARGADFGVNDQTFVIRTHLGNILKPGMLYGSHLEANFACMILRL